MAKKTLEELKLIASNAPKTYARYIAAKGISPEAALANAEAEIKNNSPYGSATYGAEGEKLAEAGLGGSGYADYLKRELIKEQNTFLITAKLFGI